VGHMVLLAAAAILMLRAGHPIRIDSGAGTTRALRSIAERAALLALFLGCSNRVTGSRSKCHERSRGNEKSDLPHHMFTPTLEARFGAEQLSLLSRNIFVQYILRQKVVICRRLNRRSCGLICVQEIVPVD